MKVFILKKQVLSVDLVKVFLFIDKGEIEKASKVFSSLLKDTRFQLLKSDIIDVIQLYSGKKITRETFYKTENKLTSKSTTPVKANSHFKEVQKFLSHFKELLLHYNEKNYLEVRAILAVYDFPVTILHGFTINEKKWFQAVIAKIKGEIEELKGKSDKALNYFKESKEVFEEIEYEPMIKPLLIKMCEQNLYLDNQIEALKTYNDLNKRLSGEDQANEFNQYSSLIIANYFEEKGDINLAKNYYHEYNTLTNNARLDKKSDERKSIEYWERIYYGRLAFYTGNYVEAKEKFQKAASLAEEIHDPIKVSRAKYHLADIYINEGIFEDALSLLYDVASCYTYYETQEGLAFALQKIAYIYYLKGEIEEAKEFLSKSIMIQEREKNRKGLAISFLRLALILIHQQLANDALYYLKLSLSFFKEKGYKLMLLETYFIYSILLLELKDHIDFEQEYRQAIQVSKEIPLAIAVAYRLSILANYLKAKKEISALSKALSLYSTIRKRYTHYFSLYINALIQILDCLYLELKLFDNQSTLKEIHETLDELESIGMKVTSYYFLALVTYLRGKMYLLELDIDRALSNMINARQIAEDKGLKPLVKAINQEIESISQSIQAWQFVLKKGMGVRDRIQFFNVDQIMNQFVKYLSMQSWNIEYEQPIIVLIYNDSGILLYSRVFDESKPINEGLITAYLSSISHFSKETFKISSNMELIRYGDYTMISLNKKNFIFTYIFTGVTHIAYKKLEMFTEEVLSNEKFVEGLSREIHGLTNNETSDLDKLTDRIFLLSEIIDNDHKTEEE